MQRMRCRIGSMLVTRAFYLRITDFLQTRTATPQFCTEPRLCRGSVIDGRCLASWEWLKHHRILWACHKYKKNCAGAVANRLRRRGGAVANRLRRQTSDQTALGSNPAVAAALSPWTRLFTPIVPGRNLHISFY